MYPSYVAVVSALLLIVQAIGIAFSGPRADLDRVEGLSTRLRKHILSIGGPVIFAYKLSRLLACLALVGFSVASLNDNLIGSRIDISNPLFAQITVCAVSVCPRMFVH